MAMHNVGSYPIAVTLPAPATDNATTPPSAGGRPGGVGYHGSCVQAGVELRFAGVAYVRPGGESGCAYYHCVQGSGKDCVIAIQRRSGSMVNRSA